MAVGVLGYAGTKSMWLVDRFSELAEEASSRQEGPRL